MLGCKGSLKSVVDPLLIKEDVHCEVGYDVKKMLCKEDIDYIKGIE